MSNKENYFLDLALRSAHQGSCTRRNYGAIIVNEKKHIVATGYTGNVSGEEHCNSLGICWRKENNIPSGTSYERCKSIHAEQNALIQAGKESYGSVIYIAGYDVETGREIAGIPCFICAKLIVNAGISSIIYRDTSLVFRKGPVAHYRELERKIFGK
ncbi:MAG: deaminase [Melioribacteraceae bacterium]|nr:deaminase [Melioribacteraceae bacterium]